jgi:hypothetical protein
MRIDRVLTPKSSFLSIEKDMSIIVRELLKNERLKRLLYYTTPDVLNNTEKCPKLTSEQSIGLIGKNIKNLPKLYIDGSVLNYVIVNFDNFVPNKKNPEFRDNLLEFDIICHFDQWQLEDFKLRPYRIAAEIDSMFDKKHLTGIGKLEFLGCSQIVLTNEFAGLYLVYRAIHGEEDKNSPANPLDNNFADEYYPGLLD